MKEKYVSKVKVPFCVHVEYFDSGQREKLVDIYQELGFTQDWVTEAYNYDGFDSDCEHDIWDRSEMFGENTTVYTLEELQAIIDGVDTHQPEVVSSEYVKWGDWQEGDEVIFCGFSNEDHSHWSFTVGKSYTVEIDGSTEGPRSNRGQIPHKNWGFNFKKKPLVDNTLASCSDDIATLDEDEYVGIASGETGSTDSVGSSVSVTTNISFDVMIRGQTFTLTPDELKELYTQLCAVEGNLQEWSIGE